MSEQELYHYGVVGMKWGIRRARRKDAKATYKKRTDKAFAEYEREIAKIEKPYKRGQNLSKKDLAREEAVEKKYADTVAKAKQDYKIAKNDRSRDAAIANRLYSRQSKEANRAVANMSTGKAVLQSMVFGSYGALKYNEAKAKGYSKGKAAVQGALYDAGNFATGGLLEISKYAENVIARKK